MAPIPWGKLAKVAGPAVVVVFLSWLSFSSIVESRPRPDPKSATPLANGATSHYESNDDPPLYQYWRHDESREMAEACPTHPGAPENKTSDPIRPSTIGAAIQRSLRDDEALFIFLSLGGNPRYCVITKRSAFAGRLPPHEALEMLIGAFRQALRTGDNTAGRIARPLFEALFGNAPSDAASKVSWLIMATTNLAGLPYSAIESTTAPSRPPYLSRVHSVALLNCVSAFVARRNPTAQPDDSVAYDDLYVGIGDPVFHAADPRAAQSNVARMPWGDGDFSAGWILPRLPGSGLEIEACSQFFRRRMVLTGSQANLNQLEKLAGLRPMVLHFATHFVNGALLSINGPGARRVFDASFVRPSRIQPKLLILNGCNSAEVHDPQLPFAGRAPTALAEMWLSNGAESVLATLWDVPDTQGDIVASFLRFWSSGATASRALQLAQCEMVSLGGWRAEPSYWAAYSIRVTD